MSQRRSSTRASSVFDELAIRLRELARQEQTNYGTGAERFKIVGLDPLRLEQHAGDLVLEEGDPDFTLGAWARQYEANYGFAVGHEAWCLREGQEWHLVDVTDPGGQAAWVAA